MRKILFLGATFSIFLFAEEPSAFNAGNLDIPKPYGLTNTEKAIVQNRDAIKELQKELFKLKVENEQLKTSFEGFKSVSEGGMGKISEFMSAQSDLQKRISDLEAAVANLSKSIEIQDKNIQKINSVLKQLSSMIDTINSDYVSRKELKGLKDVIRGQAPSAPKLDETGKSETKKSNEELFKEAQDAFFSKKYDDAYLLFDKLLKENYKPATTNFYLGEIAFAKKKYQDAIFYYKKSATLYDKASYMPTLLYHTAISFEKSGDSANAKKFYSSLINTYPDSKEAKEAANKIQ